MARKKKQSNIHRIHHHVKSGAHAVKRGAHSFAKASLLVAGFVFGVLLLTALSVGLKYELLFRKVDGKIFQVVNEHSTGTGFQVRNPKTNKTFFITNHHVCRDTDGKTVVADVNGKLVRLQILKQNEPNDMCIATPIPGIVGLEPNTDAKGSLFMIDGFGYGIKDISFGKFIRTFTRTFPLAPITAKKQYLAMYDIYTMTKEECQGDGYSQKSVETQAGKLLVCFATQTSLMGTMKSYPGNSGSPIVNLNGEVVSLVWGAMMPLNNAISVPIQKFIDLSSDL
jgi:hypothetical protein